MAIVLETQNLEKNFGDVQAVDGVSLQVQQGEVFGFLGPNGAGKTTTIGMVLGLIYPTVGSVTLFGQPVTPTDTEPLKRVGALVGAAPSLVPHLSAQENLRAVAVFHGIDSKARVAQTLALVGLEKAARRTAGKFSTGMKQRLGLAMALLHRPDLLILDEPTNGMDPSGMREVRNLLRKLADEGTTVFLSSHLLHEVEQVCDRVAVLDKGRIVAQGHIKELLGKSTVVKVRVRNTHEAAECLRTLPGVESVKPNGAYVLVSGQESERVIGHLAQHGILPSEVTTVGHDLEELFIQLTA